MIHIKTCGIQLKMVFKSILARCPIQEVIKIPDYTTYTRKKTMKYRNQRHGKYSDISQKLKAGSLKNILNRQILIKLNQKKRDGINIQFWSEIGKKRL